MKTPGLRGWLISLMLVIIVPAILLTIANVTAQFYLSGSSQQQEALRLARTVSAWQEREIQTGYTILQDQLLLAVKQPSLLCGTGLAQFFDSYQGAPGFLVARPDGTVACASTATMGSVIETDWFARAFERPQITLGEAIINSETGTSGLAVALPLLNEASEIGAVLVTPLNMPRLLSYLDDLNPPDGSLLMIVNEAGTVLAHSENPDLPGQPLANRELLALVQRNREGVFDVMDVQTDEEFIYGFAPLIDGNTGITVLIGLPEADIFADAYRMLWLNLLALVLLASFAGGLAWWGGNRFIVNPIQALAATTRRLADGHLESRTGLHYPHNELGNLAALIDTMAATLEQRAAEAEHAAAERQRMIEERAALQADVIATQEESIRQLSAPLIPIAEGIIAVPLVGDIDAERTAQITRNLLHDIERQRTRTAIVDVTGIHEIDTDSAAALLQMAQAVRLLGARIILTGVQPDVAAALVSLGVDMSTMQTRSTLQQGIALALQKQPSQAIASSTHQGPAPTPRPPRTEE